MLGLRLPEAVEEAVRKPNVSFKISAGEAFDYLYSRRKDFIGWTRPYHITAMRGLGALIRLERIGPEDLRRYAALLEKETQYFGASMMRDLADLVEDDE